MKDLQIACNKHKLQQQMSLISGGLQEGVATITLSHLSTLLGGRTFPKSGTRLWLVVPIISTVCGHIQGLPSNCDRVVARGGFLLLVGVWMYNTVMSYSVGESVPRSLGFQ